MGHIGQCDTGGRDGGDQRNDGLEARVARCHAEVEREHAGEVHGPDADAAQGGAGCQKIEPVDLAAAANALCSGQCHEGPQYGNAIGEGDEPHFIGGLQDLADLLEFVHDDGGVLVAGRKCVISNAYRFLYLDIN